jgi:hypothetical protein
MDPSIPLDTPYFHSLVLAERVQKPAAAPKPADDHFFQDSVTLGPAASHVRAASTDLASGTEKPVNPVDKASSSDTKALLP